jgi:hypothetical protein
MMHISRLAAFAAIVALSAAAATASDPSAFAGIPEGTVVKVHLAQAASSNRVRTGDSIALVIAEDVSSGGKVVIAKDAPAVGKVQLAGIAGMNGHEGNLKIVAVSTRTIAGELVSLGGSISSDGKQRKALAFMASRWIRGDDVTIAPETVFEAHVGTEEAAASPAPSPSP